jgi:hypothetical protein
LFVELTVLPFRLCSRDSPRFCGVGGAVFDAVVGVMVHLLWPRQHCPVPQLLM